MNRTVKKRYLLLVLLSLIILLFFKSDWIAAIMYPIHYKEHIRISATKYNVDPHMVAAIIRSESNYKTGKESKKGALGLMQIMPNTANWVAQQAGFNDIDDEKLRFHADVSIEVGVWYLHSLLKQFDHNMIVTIAAYNAGPGNVRKWLDSGQWNGNIDSVKHIPFGETRHYIQRVIYYYNKYKNVYPQF